MSFFASSCALMTSSMSNPISFQSAHTHTHTNTHIRTRNTWMQTDKLQTSSTSTHSPSRLYNHPQMRALRSPKSRENSTHNLSLSHSLSLSATHTPSTPLCISSTVGLSIVYTVSKLASFLSLLLSLFHTRTLFLSRCHKASLNCYNSEKMKLNTRNR